MVSMWHTVAAFIGSFAGAGSIILFFSNILANNYAKSIDARYSKELAQYKNELDLTLQKVSLLNEHLKHVNNQLFDDEYKMYQKINKALYATYIASDRLFSGVQKNVTDLMKYKYFESDSAYLWETINEATRTIRENRPFINSDLFLYFQEIICEADVLRDYCIAAKTVNSLNDANFNIIIGIYSRVDKSFDDMQDRLKDYMDSLKIKDSYS